MNKAVETVSKKMNITINEFAVAGLKHDNLFAHQWYVACDNPNVNVDELKNQLDQTLSMLNDDYEVERTSALREIFVEVLPSSMFLDYLKGKGKEGAMNKFPRVLKGAQLEDWKQYLEKGKLSAA